LFVPTDLTSPKSKEPQTYVQPNKTQSFPKKNLASGALVRLATMALILREVLAVGKLPIILHVASQRELKLVIPVGFGLARL
jgi:hypothetical protein